MAGNVLLLQSNPSGATATTAHTTIGSDANGRIYYTDINDVVLYASVRSVLPFANSTGNTTLTFPPNANELTAEVQISGGASARNLVLDVTGRLTNDILKLRINTGTTAGVSIDVKNATAGGTSLTGSSPFVTTGDGTDNVFWHLQFDGTAWQSLGLLYPTL